MELWAIALLFLGGVVLVTVMAVLGSAKLADMLIGEKHRAIEEIVDTGQIPAKWRKRFDGECTSLAEIARLGQEPMNAARVANTQRRAQGSYLKKLDGLIHYMQVTRLVESEKARREVLDKLNSLRQTLTQPQATQNPPEQPVGMV